MFRKCIILSFFLTVSVTLARQRDQMELGRLQAGAIVSFVRTEEGQWGIEISGSNILQMTQQKPAQIEIFRGQENVQQLASGYQSVQKLGDAVLAKAKIAGDSDAAFAVEDLWKVSDTELLLSRNVSVISTEPDAGFYSEIRFSTTPSVKWEDVNCLIPGLLYGQYGGRFNYSAKRFKRRRPGIRRERLRE